MATLVGSIFILIGLIFVPIAYRKVVADKNSLQWPETTARLTGVEIVKFVRERPQDEHSGVYTNYSCGLKYEYEIAGKTHAVQWGEPADNASHAAQLCATHTPGETRPVWVNPGNHEEHRFERGNPYAGLAWLLPFLAFAGFGWLVIRFA